MANQTLDAQVAASHQASGGDHPHPLNFLLFIVGDLIRVYDGKHLSIPDAWPAEMVPFLTEQHALRQSDLPAIGAQRVVSAVLNGKRALMVRQLKRPSLRPAIEWIILCRRKSEAAWTVQSSQVIAPRFHSRGCG